MDFVAPKPFRDRSDVTIVWKGRRIAKLVFSSGKVVEFDEPIDVDEKGIPRMDPQDQDQERESKSFIPNVFWRRLPCGGAFSFT